MSGEIIKRLNEIKGQLNEEKLAEEGFQYFRKITPFRSGNAKRNTFRNDDTIQADYPYARRLDSGYSRQAPDGMTQPTVAFIKDYIKKQSKG